MSSNDTPFHPQDQIRNTRFKQLYHWAMSIGKQPSNAFFLAKKRTLQDYPIVPGETFYPITHK